ncbi:MAG: TolC family protein [Muribaculaceae bacterium]|nr:TolC family protein [Muribaculaceae bacterium]
MKLYDKSLYLAIVGSVVLTPIAAFGQTMTDNVAADPAIAVVDPVAVSKAAPLRISREECIAIALQDNPTIRIANLEVNRLDYSKKEVRASLFPSIDFSGAYQRTIDLQTMRMDFGGQSQNLKVGSQNTWNFGFTASMPIISASLWKSIQISDVQILSAWESARASKLDLVDQVNKAYYALLLAIASRQVLQENYEITKFNADLYAQQFEYGTASEYDVLRSSVAVKNLEPELLQADIAVKQCQLQLKVLMGIDYAVEIEPNVTLAELQRDMYAYPLGAGDNISNNTSLRSLDIQRKMLEKTVTLRKFAWIPTLGASYNINWIALSNGNALKNQQFNPYSTVALALNVPIFSGGSKYFAVKQAQVQLKELDFQREYLVNSLNMQVELALDNINREAQQISSSEESMKQAKKAHSIMQKSFEIGAATYLDLRDAELADTSAQLAYYQAIYNFLVSSSELDNLLGKEDYFTTEEGEK